ncbi:sialidase family protein [Paraflavitalea pollutisoli]|uniref:sialidase family protein n=1 Tax=Paraflavitalea pollutisoli TaxID=3034143 RepID=UPI0023ED7788|nr:sialidase family protein [Paraflavitalea sp. H1-2-19X]
MNLIRLITVFLLRRSISGLAGQGATAMLRLYGLPLGLFVLPLMATAQQQVPGTIVDHSPKSSGRYIGSPSLCVLPDGSYLASHDYFGPNSQEKTAGIVKVFHSRDKGASWSPIAELNGQYWSKLFAHHGKVYILGTSKEYGDLVIRRSDDGGHTWTTPSDPLHGLLRTGRFHCAPTPVIEHNGQLWRAIEDAMGPVAGWGKSFQAVMMHIPVDADLLQASNWRYASPLPYDSSYLNGKFGGWLEGNAVVAPDGAIRNILRVHFVQKGSEKAAIATLSADGASAAFDPSAGFVEFPGGAKKFSIRYDKSSKRYWTLSNYVPQEYENNNQERVRNTLALCSSADLHTWQVERIVLQSTNTGHHGFQYADWQFEGRDIIAVIRTAYDDAEGGADNQHNANYLIFHRIDNYRK